MVSALGGTRRELLITKCERDNAINLALRHNEYNPPAVSVETFTCALRGTRKPCIPRSENFGIAVCSGANVTSFGGRVHFELRPLHVSMDSSVTRCHRSVSVFLCTWRVRTTRPRNNVLTCDDFASILRSGGHASCL